MTRDLGLSLFVLSVVDSFLCSDAAYTVIDTMSIDLAFTFSVPCTRMHRSCIESALQGPFVCFLRLAYRACVPMLQFPIFTG